jgi:hypothetical protein
MQGHLRPVGTEGSLRRSHFRLFRAYAIRFISFSICFASKQSKIQFASCPASSYRPDSSGSCGPEESHAVVKGYSNGPPGRLDAGQCEVMNAVGWHGPTEE